MLTGLGRSEFAGECARPALSRELGIVSEVVGLGALLTRDVDARARLVVSQARSGDSPESAGAILRLLECDAGI